MLNYEKVPIRKISKDSRVVKGDGLKHRCICFVGSNPTPCIFLEKKSIISLH